MRAEAPSAFLVALLTLAVAAGCSSSGPGAAESAGVKATYSKTTGRLELITYDTNKDGKVFFYSFFYKYIQGELRMHKYFIVGFSLILLTFLSCGIQTKSTELKHFPIDNLNETVAQSGIQFDKAVSSDGKGSIKIEAAGPAAIPLFIIDDVRIDDSQLIYEAKVKSESLNGQAYLEMWCIFKDKNEYYSRGFDSAIAGTTDWRTIKTVFLLKKNEMPDQIKLNVVVNGVGTVWIDDIHLSKL